MKYLSLVAAASVLLWTGCSYSHYKEPVPYSVDNTAAGESSVFAIPAQSDILLDYTLDIGTAPKDIYMVFSNPSSSQSTAAPGFLSSAASRGSLSLSTEHSYQIQRDKPKVRAFNENPPAFIPIAESSSERSEKAASSDQISSTTDFYDDENNSVAATCRYVSPSAVTTSTGARTLNIWVANDCWDGAGTGKAYYVTQAMVDSLAKTFLNTLAWNNGVPQKVPAASFPTGTESYDIYGLDTSIFGAEWGTHQYSNLIQADGNITILLMDIDGDNRTDGGTLGFFYSRDCFLTKSASTSNQRMMFYIDAVMFADPSHYSKTASADPWNILASYWPNELISTLAHEFQHMIQFYQKRVLRGGSSDTWLNEMCSMVAEDFASSYLGTSGPRAVAYNDATSGSSNNQDGRITDFIGYSDRSLFSWTDYPDVLHSYGESYTFGSFLARSCGGTPLFRNIVQSKYSGSDAITAALAATGSTETFDTVFAKWGAAMILSSSTTAPAGYAYNTGTWFTSTADTITYKLGSINLYNYYDGTYTGPKLFTSMPETVPAAGSQTILYEGTMSGSQHWKLSIPEGITLSVVVK